MLNKCVSPTLRQYLVIITANLSYITVGLNVAWSSPVLVNLKDERQTVVPRQITEEEGSWLASIGCLSGLILLPVIGRLSDGIGRKTCIIIGFIPRITMCFVLMFASEVWVLFLGRAIDGLANIFVLCVVPTYASEIASKESRGALGTISQVASAVGMLIVFGVGPFVDYFELHVIYTCIIGSISVPIWFIPETPYHLYSKGAKEESQRILTYLRGSETLAIEEIKQYSLSQPKISKREVFSDKTTLKTLTKVILMSMLLELLGYTAVMFYMQTVLQSTHTSVKDEIASVINGCIQLIACFFTILLTDRFGRKPILVTTIFGMAIGMFGLGSFFHLQQKDVPISGFLNFLPLLSMMLIIFCFNAGMGSIFWMVVAELFDGPARAIGLSIGAGVATFFVFLTTKYLPFVTQAIGPANTYWILGFNCIVTALFMLFFIPETKGKTFAEIQVELGRKIDKTALDC